MGNHQSELNLDLLEKLENQASFKSKLLEDSQKTRDDGFNVSMRDYIGKVASQNVLQSNMQKKAGIKTASNFYNQMNTEGSTQMIQS